MEIVDITKNVQIDSFYTGYGGSDIKASFMYKGKRYMFKFQNVIEDEKRNSLNQSYSDNVISEDIGCKIFKSLGIETQNTFQAIYDGRLIVACENFIPEGYGICEFEDLEESARALGMITSEKARTPKLNQVQKILENIETLENIRQEAIERYWDTFVGDSLIGNFDRHTGNWGYLINQDTKDVKLAPVYDCGSSLYPQMSEEGAKKVLGVQKEIDRRIYEFPKAALMVNGEKVAYHEFLCSHMVKECDEAIKRIYPRIDKKKICRIIDENPALGVGKKEFLKTMTQQRIEKILQPAYAQIMSRQKSYMQDAIQTASKRYGHEQDIEQEREYSL